MNEHRTTPKRRPWAVDRERRYATPSTEAWEAYAETWVAYRGGTVRGIPLRAENNEMLLVDADGIGTWVNLDAGRLVKERTR